MIKIADWVASPNYHFGNAKEDSIVGFEFQWLGEASDILYMYPSCSGCTVVEYDPSRKVIKGQLNMGALAFNPGRNVLNKHIHVFLTGEPEFISDEKLVRKPNPNAKRIRLQISGVVQK